MKTSLKIEHPATIEFTLTITMTLSEWVQLSKQLNGTDYPAWKLNEQINSMVTKAEQQFWEHEEEQ